MGPFFFFFFSNNIGTFSWNVLLQTSLLSYSYYNQHGWLNVKFQVTYWITHSSVDCNQQVIKSTWLQQVLTVLLIVINILGPKNYIWILIIIF